MFFFSCSLWLFLPLTGKCLPSHWSSGLQITFSPLSTLALLSHTDDLKQSLFLFKIYSLCWTRVCCFILPFKLLLKRFISDNEISRGSGSLRYILTWTRRVVSVSTVKLTTFCSWMLLLKSFCFFLFIFLVIYYTDSCRSSWIIQGAAAGPRSFQEMLFLLFRTAGVLWSCISYFFVTRLFCRGKRLQHLQRNAKR